MKVSVTHRIGYVHARGHLRAFTLVEIMVTMMIALIIIGALLSSYVYGMRMFSVVQPKLDSSDESRHTLSKIVAEVRSAAVIELGTGTESTFTPVAFNVRQAGNAIQIYPDPEKTNLFTRYFLDTGDDTLRRITSGMAESQVLARDITNAVPFTAEDHLGQVLTNNLNNRVIGVHLQFAQLPKTLGKIKAGSLYDYYQLRTRITRRTIF